MPAPQRPLQDADDAMDTRPRDIELLLKEIDEAIGETSEGVPIHLVRRSEPTGDGIWFEKITRLASALERLSPPRSVYRRMADEILRLHAPPENSRQTVERLKAVLLALKQDIAEDHLRSTAEIIHGDILTDMLEMAERFIRDGFKDPAAVLAGSILAEHLRRLCSKHSIAVQTLHGDETIPKNVARMNTDLLDIDVYTTAMGRSIECWNNLRCHALLGKYDVYTREEAALFVAGLRDFITRHPA